MMLRSFVAIELPAIIQDALARQTANLRQHYPKPEIRWVQPGNIHLTLKFLGESSPNDLDLLARSLDFEVSQIEPFTISFSEMGIFPNARKPRIIWVGISAPAILVTLHSKIEAITSKLGHQTENRPFSPHITLGRIGNSYPTLNLQKMLIDLGSINVALIDPVDISEIKIFKSDLKSNGPIYTAIHTIPFGKINNQRGEI
jgi:2'-5' RNA ligase